MPQPASDNAWAETCPGALDTPEPRRQPPLREVLHGLDCRELEGPTVFDELFGPLPDPPIHAPRAPARAPSSHQPNGRTPNRR